MLSTTQNMQALLAPLLKKHHCRLAFLERVGTKIQIALEPLEESENKTLDLKTFSQLYKMIRTLFHAHHMLPDTVSLEVGSPGLDRPLLTPEDYKRFEKKPIQLTLHAPVDGQRRFQGLLHQADATQISLILDPTSSPLVISFDQIHHCKLVPIL